MDQTKIHQTDMTFGLLSKVVAGVVFVSFVIGLSFSLGWSQGFGLVSGQFGSNEFISFLGFLATFSLVPEILSELASALSNWKVWVFSTSLLLVWIDNRANSYHTAKLQVFEFFMFQ